ncbi:MAG: O-antigen ligase family protein [Anaerolineales bacterium]|nr:O-antigen ligase family protein [Anaerolineales bacterium]
MMTVGNLKQTTPTGWLATAALLGLLTALLPLDFVVMIVGGLLLAAVLLAILAQPFVGLALTLLAGPFGALENVILGGNVPIDSGQILLLLTLGSWLARGLARRRVYLPQVSLLWPLSLFTAVTAVSVLSAPSTVLGLTELLKWIEISLVMIMVVDLGREWQAEHSQTKGIHLLLGIILLAGVSQALIGIWQFGLRGHGPEHFLVLGRFYRAYGTFEQPNPFGGYMELNGTLAIGALIGLLMVWGRGLYEQRRAFWQKMRPYDLLVLGGTAVCALALTIALLMSWSRGAWLGYTAGLGALAFFWPKRQWQGVIIVALGAMLLFGAWQADLIPASISTRLTTIVEEFRLGDVRGVDINDANYAVLERLAFWQAAVNMAQDNFWLGVGFGNYAAAYPDYALINWTTALGHAHNYYLNLLAETGILGILAYAVVWVTILWQNMVLLRHLTWPNRGIALGLLGSWTALTVHQLVDKLYVNNIYVHIGAMLGLQQLLVMTLKNKYRGMDS